MELHRNQKRSPGQSADQGRNSWLIPQDLPQSSLRDAHPAAARPAPAARGGCLETGSKSPTAPLQPPNQVASLLLLSGDAEDDSQNDVTQVSALNNPRELPLTVQKAHRDEVPVVHVALEL